jgi:hypothetical protein
VKAVIEVEVVRVKSTVFDLAAQVLTRLLVGSGFLVNEDGELAHSFGINHGIWTDDLAYKNKQTNKVDKEQVDAFHKIFSFYLAFFYFA